jgi:hypothetical protein
MHKYTGRVQKTEEICRKARNHEVAEMAVFSNLG